MHEKEMPSKKAEWAVFRRDYADNMFVFRRGIETEEEALEIVEKQNGLNHHQFYWSAQYKPNQDFPDVLDWPHPIKRLK